MNDASLPLPVTIADIRRAQAAIAGAVAHTPTIRAASLSEMAATTVRIRCVRELPEPRAQRTDALQYAA